MHSESPKDNPEMVLMIFLALGVDEDVVNKDYDKLINLFMNSLFMRFMKKAGALVRPKGITLN
jgi:hypothetical protein